jgi:hypothetical protein
LKYYLSSPSSCIDVLEETKLFDTVLSSYAVDAKKMLPICQERKYDVMVDSGAFSIFNRGAVVDIDEYYGFIEKFPKEWKYINLDVIPPRNASKKEIQKCADEGYENYLYLKKKVKNLLPVYHYGEDIKIFERYCQDTDYVCVGIKRIPGISNEEYYSKIFSISKDEIKIHGLANTSIKNLLNYPFYSVDSITYQRGRFMKKQYWAHGRLRALLYDSLRYWKYMERQITSIWNERGIIWD